MLKTNKIPRIVMLILLLSICPVVVSCSSPERQDDNPNVVTKLNLPNEPGTYEVESNSWTTIPAENNEQIQVHIVRCTNGQTYVIPYEDTAMTTVGTDVGTLVVNDDAVVSDSSSNGSEVSRGEEVKKYQLLLPSKDWSGRVQRGDGKYER